MKKMTLLFSALFSVLFLLPVSAELRIYIVYGDNRNEDLPTDEYTCIDYRRDDNQVALWAGGMVGPGHPTSGGYYGTSWMQYWTSEGAEKYDFMFACKAGQTIDLSKVTSEWTFHMAFYPENEAGKDFEVVFADADATEYSYTVPGALLADGWQWNEIDIEMSEFVELGFDFANKGVIAPSQDQIFFRIRGFSPIETTSTMGLDDIYITDNDTYTAIAKVDATRPMTLAQGNGLLKVVNAPAEGFALYNAAGMQVLESAGNIASVSALAPGIYFVKSGNQVMKFMKR